MAPGLLSVWAMDDEAENEVPADPVEPEEPVHQFTVNRGMLTVLVIETPCWYGGLLQAAVARITLEGYN